MTALRIGVNALYLIPGEVGGTEIYLRSLLAALGEIGSGHEFVVFVNRESAADPPVRDSPPFRIVLCPVTGRNRPQRIFWEQAVFPFVLRNKRIDILFNPGFTMPVLFRGTSVTVFHDLQHKRHPEFFRWFDLPFWNLLLWAAAKCSRRLIAVSEATAKDLARYYPETVAKTAIVPHGVDPEFFSVGERRARRSQAANPDPWLLTVSTLHPHKNLERLMEAFRIFRNSHPEFRLVVAGLKGFAAGGLETRRRELGLEDSVTFTGWIPRADLYRLFEYAEGYIAPSRFEGFGMPILEALAAGIPSACSATPPLGEIAGAAAIQFHPDSTDEMAAAMESIITDAAFRARAVVDGPARARQFDWNTAAALTLKVIETK